MSITYEEALSTLGSMFGQPWSEETLDLVLRHYEGHMENTVESILGHGDGDPQVLLQKLEESKSTSSPDQMALDEQLARQIASGGGGGGGQSGQSGSQNQAPARNIDNLSTQMGSTTLSPSSSSITTTATTSSATKGKGHLTQLPPDFLRIPGTVKDQVDDDAALARMLQDQLFADELKNNPEFAHLARGGGGQGVGRMVGVSPNYGSGYPGIDTGDRNQNNGPNVLTALQGMGDNAKKRLQILADKFKEQVNNANQNRTASGGRGGSSGASERRGLLNVDEYEEEISFARRPNNDYEMSAFSSGGKKED